jgi:Mg2+ and Co2+ transporter CorA
MTPLKSILPPAWKVPERFKSRLGEGVGRQRPMAADGHLLLVLHAPPGPDDLERSGRLFWRDADGQWKSNTLGSGVQSLKNHLHEFADRIDKLDDRLESSRRAAEYFTLLQEIAPLHRTTRHMHAVLQQAREMLPDDREVISLRDRAGDLERAVELLHTDAKNALDFKVAQESETQSQRAYELAVSAHRLNLLAAIFLPIAALSSIFGMNVTEPLKSWDSPTTFWIVLAIGILSGVVLTAALGRRPRPGK